ncbi:MAG: EAL domain-containing protein [Rhodospirillales bacterium]|nr:EAL domain-containing protein [Rhodospirillales bacterium]
MRDLATGKAPVEQPPPGEFERTQKIEDNEPGEFDQTRPINDPDSDALTKTSAIKDEEPGEFDSTKPLEENKAGEFDPTKPLKENKSGDFEKTRPKEEKTYDFGLTKTKEDFVPVIVRTQTVPEESPILLDKNSFLESAQGALDMARSVGDEVDMTLLDIPAVQQAKTRLGEELWDQFTDALTEFLAGHSLGGDTVAEIAQGRYSIIHDKTIDSETLRSRVEELAKDKDPDGEGFDIQSKTVTADLQTLSERETTKALIYTINEFERKGADLSIDNLNSSFKAYVGANAQKMQQMKSMIEQLNFELHFQPIVSLKDYELAHYEVLTRFRGESSTQEWVIFSEDVGMAADLDIAVCERVINYLLYKAAGSRTKYAINLSGQSIQNEQFFKTLMAKLTLNKALADRMIFEITESTTITELEMVNSFIGAFRKKGFAVCLDDFGAGAASFQYLNKLDVDFVKIDGLYTQKLLTSEKDRIMIKNLNKMCKDLEIGVVAERIETEEQAICLRNMDIPFGQGFLFGKPGPWPSYDKENLKFTVPAK